jgi:hypothetical protein
MPSLNLFTNMSQEASTVKQKDAREWGDMLLCFIVFLAKQEGLLLRKAYLSASGTMVERLQPCRG